MSVVVIVSLLHTVCSFVAYIPKVFKQVYQIQNPWICFMLQYPLEFFKLLHIQNFYRFT